MDDATARSKVPQETPALSPEALARRADLTARTAVLARAMSAGGLTLEMMENGLPWQKLRLRQGWRLLYVAQAGLCSLCREFMVPAGRRGGPRARVPSITEEHVHPRVRGGGGRGARNVVLAHGACNAAKGGRLPSPAELAYAEAVWDLVQAAQIALDAQTRAAAAERREARMLRACRDEQP